MMWETWVALSENLNLSGQMRTFLILLVNLLKNLAVNLLTNIIK